MKWVAKTFFGLENVLKEEIIGLGGKNVSVENRAVAFEGDATLMYKANICLRTAISVLQPVISFTINTERDLYKKVKSVDWTKYFSADKTFAVRGAVHSSLFAHSQYPMLLVKDAIADQFRAQTGKRPNVDVKHPMVLIDLYMAEDKVTLSLNTSGAPLFKRGYRTYQHEAPINECLAAGLILLSGWDGSSTFVDPMCGSGTIPIEAGLIANNIPPNINRRLFSFKHFNGFEEHLFSSWLAEQNNRPLKQDFEIIGFDKDPQVILGAKENLKGTSLGRNVRFMVQDIRDKREPYKSPGVIITNPPYDERLEVDYIEELYKTLGDHFKNYATGFRCSILSADKLALKSVGLKTSAKTILYNGKLKCGFYTYDIYEGSKKNKAEL